MPLGLPPATISARCVFMYATAGNFAVRSGVMKMPLITMLHFFAASAGSRPGKAVLTNVAFTFQSFPIAFAMSMSKPIGLPDVVFDSIGGKVGSSQYLNEPLTGEIPIAPAVPTATSAASSTSGRMVRFMTPPDFSRRRRAGMRAAP
jgi:hypothetical protein